MLSLEEIIEISEHTHYSCTLHNTSNFLLARLTLYVDKNYYGLPV
jgi:hypothetical protein